MIVVISADHGLAREVAAAAGAGEDVQSADAWQNVSRHTRVRASACVHVAPRLRDGARAEIADIRRAQPNLPLILVTERVQDVFRAVRSLNPSDVVWLERVTEDLPSALANLARRESVAARLALLLESDARMAETPLLRTLLEILRHGTKVPSLRSLARSAKRTEKAIAGDFRALFDLERVCVQWRRAARTAITFDCNTGDRLPAKEAARLLGIDIRTLRISIRRTTGVTYGQLLCLPPDEVLRRLAASLGLSVAMRSEDSPDTAA